MTSKPNSLIQLSTIPNGSFNGADKSSYSPSDYLVNEISLSGKTIKVTCSHQNRPELNAYIRIVKNKNFKQFQKEYLEMLIFFFKSNIILSYDKLSEFAVDTAEESKWQQ